MPGMIGSGLVSLALIEEGLVDLFGLHDFGLFGLLVKNGVVQGFAFIEDGDVSLIIQADSHRRIAHGVGGALGLDLVDDLVKLQGQVLGENACLLPGEETGGVVLRGERAMGVILASGLDCKAAIEIVHEFWQEGIACLPVRDATQTEFFGKAILEGLVDPLNPAFGLRGIGTDDLDIQCLHGPPKLGQGVRRAYRRLIDPENTMFVAVEGDWLAAAGQIAFRRPAIAEKALAFHEQ